jgi:hypothetical protein
VEAIEERLDGFHEDPNVLGVAVEHLAQHVSLILDKIE